jgi:hypothetical protein
MRVRSNVWIVALCLVWVWVLAPLSAQSKPKKVKDGEAATVSTSLSEPEATAKVKAYFNSTDLNFTVNQDSGRIISDWYGERSCGPFSRCEIRAMVRVVREDDHTVIRVQVFGRDRGSASDGAWRERSTSQGKETSDLAATLEAFITK